ncbi:LPS-assembly lipoprotein lptE [Blochmannia endosymbiont of Polyrhachis (Hedomyrma) turneri]|nr:LPS-assembly lipoprotein lptE [Blochmannia endosymbiont of Polyrhachis (Hedomyrma) turneri]
MWLRNSVLIILIFTSGCAYDIITHDVVKKNNHPFINLYSYNSYNFLTKITKEKLHMNNISYIDCNTYKYQCNRSAYISLYIIHTLEKCITKSLFSDGQPAEYQMILTTTIKIVTPTNKYYPSNIVVSKSFFNDPVKILANSIKENTIRKKIYEEISEELTFKLLDVIKKYY